MNPTLDIRQIRDELLSLLSLCGTLAGVSITVVALINTRTNGNPAGTIVDDIFAVCALTFLFCIYLIIWTLRKKQVAPPKVVINVIDVVLLLTMSAMILGAFIMVYTIW